MKTAMENMSQTPVVEINLTEKSIRSVQRTVEKNLQQTISIEKKKCKHNIKRNKLNLY